MSAAKSLSISELAAHAGETVTLKGWLYHRRAGGKIRFLVLRDGSGYLQAVVSKAEGPEAVWNEADRATQEATLEGTGTLRLHPPAPRGAGMSGSDLKNLDPFQGLPI